MPQIKKKGTTGQAKNFITRTQAKESFEGVYAIYHLLLHPRYPIPPPRAITRKIQRTQSGFEEDREVTRKGEVGDAARLEKNHVTKLTLDHIIKQRYPTFVDALRDLDDALSLLFLFSSLPSTLNVPPKTISLCQRLCLEFEHYLITTHSLHKSFLSIKGIYYQATIQGQDILWLVPYKFVQRMTGDVDFRIMATFVEFYTTLLGFVNFRLYTSIGLVYPPKFNAKSDEEGGELSALMLESRGIDGSKQIEAPPAVDIEQSGPTAVSEDVQKQIQAIQETTETAPSEERQDSQADDTDQPTPPDAIDTFSPTAPDADTLLQPSASDSTTSTLFAPFTFFLSREVPKASIEFLLRAFGCKRIGWDSVLGDGAYTTNEFDPSITHQIVDRPPLGAEAWNTTSAAAPDDSDADEDEPKVVVQRGWPANRMPGRIYIQPQWVWDCINQVQLLRPDLYAPGATLPPHLSPWVKPSKGAYDPTAPLAQEAVEQPALENGEAEPELVEDDEESAEEDEEEIEDSTHDKSGDTVSETSFTGFDASIPNARSSTERLHQDELLAEAEGVALPQPKLKGILKKENGAARQRERERAARQEEEELERRKMMMPNRKRKLVEKMLYSNKVKDGERERLEGKRRRIEKEGRGGLGKGTGTGEGEGEVSGAS
ncbi:uncharacterized protein KY384_001770 [Bacidia gigantensis]|uniref:uncharacterized protein n=1 Tax=Bacidia gigantensis TaxID=2732470 RepID=UPI001D052C52|nr:uncharacterized protein KY384_001770 [Bacidia gigantensis]KAG8532988.1 hypothetical protein KY384_001770 [Bacidia gigantensis]